MLALDELDDRFDLREGVCMPDTIQERVWTFKAENDADVRCSACDVAFKAGDRVVTCPRCREIHHFHCWTEKGACSTFGCSQLASPALVKDKPNVGDPPTKESFAWLPWVLTISIILLLAGGFLYNHMKRRDAKNILTVMVPADFDAPIIQQLGEEFAQKHPPYKVNVLTIPQEEQLFYEEKLVIMLVARDAPEIIFLPYDRFLYYARQGALASLESIRQMVKDIVPYGERLDYGMFDNTLYGIPHPSKAGLFSIISITDNQELSKRLLLEIIAAMPYTEGIDDRRAAPPPTFLDALRKTAQESEDAAEQPD